MSRIKPVLLVAGLVVLWELFSRQESFPRYVLPPPTVIGSFAAAHWRIIFAHALVTLREALMGFGLSALVGVCLGILIVRFRLLEETLLPLLITSQVIPTIAIAPLLVIWLGFGSAPKIAVAFLVSFFPIVVNTVVGLRAVDEDLLHLVRGLSATRWQELRKVRFPNALPYIFAGLRVAITLALIGSVVGEFVSADQGLGFLILTGAGRLETEQIFVSIAILGFAGVLMFHGVRWLERVLLPWLTEEQRG
ncbi:MAG: ABC transporter permease [Armatimonadota bacterium]|nr:ABC transporter permease [Armatimonadota bacterium]MDR7448419.1 ABC transporter permease [Armatimonadota bacterium]MDR7459570.1 ABC transporter permease [Armatimonadota bacterium]MDR7480343.1 ABC transporter permease [Armatimonadota bacterium]MDR7488310.1 ABC transporter permease [Armatimonadota bacterium]